MSRADDVNAAPQEIMGGKLKPDDTRQPRVRPQLLSVEPLEAIAAVCPEFPVEIGGPGKSEVNGCGAQVLGS